MSLGEIIYLIKSISADLPELFFPIIKFTGYKALKPCDFSPKHLKCLAVILISNGVIIIL